MWTDLQPHPAFQGTAQPVLAIGWHATGESSGISTADSECYERLVRLFIEVPSVVAQAGPVFCRSCRFSRGPTAIRSSFGDVQSNSILVCPGESAAFAVPGLVLHAMDAHAYSPPPTFQVAVERFSALSKFRRIAALRAILGPSFPSGRQG